LVELAIGLDVHGLFWLWSGLAMIVSTWAALAMGWNLHVLGLPWADMITVWAGHVYLTMSVAGHGLG
jgi:hypothetical protein